jgi:catechol 2,3-dioxygenase-like lactoylglutathione lyase family enzyme
MFHSIDHVILPAKDLAEAAAPFERLGLTLSPRAPHGSAGTANRVFFVGGESNHFYVELLAVEDEAAARSAGGRGYLLDALGGEPALARVMFETDDIAGVGLAGEGAAYEVHRGDGSKIGDVRALTKEAGFGAGAIQYTTPSAERFAARKGRGWFDSEFVLKRIDHLAVIAPDLDATTEYWGDVLGVLVFGEVSNDALVIRQMKIGDAIVELLAPASPDSPLAARPPGLSSMVAFEVEDLDAAVEQARSRGFEVPDGRVGVLPGTRVASISADQLSGLTMQLLEYV